MSQVIELINKNSSARVSTLGGHVQSLVLDGKDILKGVNDGNPTHGGCAIMIPYANRVRYGTFNFNGKQYYLPRNEEGNSIHGLLLDKEFQIISEDINRLTYHYFMNDINFQFPLDITLTYSLSHRRFTLKVNIKNVGKEVAPIMVGAHPYFYVEGSYFIDTYESTFKLNYIDSYFPDGRGEFIELKSINFSLGQFDNTFLGGGPIILKSDYSEIMITRKNMPFFVLYNGKYAEKKSIAIEPMTGAPDSFNNKIGLITINQGKVKKFEFSIKLIK